MFYLPEVLLLLLRNDIARPNQALSESTTSLKLYVKEVTASVYTQNESHSVWA
jgi:hypothetical protein